jgi:hypothetical protein
VFHASLLLEMVHFCRICRKTPNQVSHNLGEVDLASFCSRPSRSWVGEVSFRWLDTVASFLSSCLFIEGKRGSYRRARLRIALLLIELGRE